MMNSIVKPFAYGSLVAAMSLGIAACGGSDDDDNGSGPASVTPVQLSNSDVTSGADLSMSSNDGSKRLVNIRVSANTQFTDADGNVLAVSETTPVITDISYSSNDFEGIDPIQLTEYEAAENLIFAIGDSVTVLGAAVIDMSIGGVKVKNIQPPLTITLAVDSLVADGEEVVIGSFDIDSGEEVVRPEATVTVANGEVSFTMDHLTTAAVVGGAVVAGAVIVEENNDDEPPSGGEGNSN